MKKYILTLLFVIGIAISGTAQSGYRGFVDLAPGYATANSRDTDMETVRGNFTISLSTVHGYQFNKHIFAGIGAQLSYLGECKFWYNDIDDVYSRGGASFPIFAMFRYDYSLLSAHSFYWALRGGYSLGLSKGSYCGAEIGLHMQPKHLPIGLNLGLRTELLIDATNDIYWKRSGRYYWNEEFSTIWGIKLAFSVEF